VADHLYIRNDYAGRLRDEVFASPAGKRGEAVYSDLGMMTMQWIVERITGRPLDEYVEEQFYKPLGLGRTAFNPLSRFEAGDLVPTELDTVFRHQLIRGYVHDPAAAMMGGVGGHAGLFSDAFDLAVIMQMLQNGGTYGGRRYLSEKTVRLFTATAYPHSANRRGLVFDKPLPGGGGPACDGASPAAFGHQGFTGTCAWSDPERKIVFVFLSNRVHPSAANDKLVKMNVRTDVMQLVYDARMPEGTDR